jgi:hypothetical protein
MSRVRRDAIALFPLFRLSRLHGGAQNASGVMAPPARPAARDAHTPILT